MKRFYRILLLCSIYLYISLAVEASFRHLNVEDGLSSRQTFQITKDSVGFIWIFTSMGIDRYDGTEFRHYKLNENIESKDHILSFSTMSCDAEGRLWVSIKNGEIYSYDYTKDDFTPRIKLSDYFQQSPDLNCIYFDDHNRLWLCVTNGLFFIEPESDDIHEIAGFSGNNVTKITQHNDNFYVGTDSRLFCFSYDVNEKDHSVIDTIPLDAGKIESLHIDGNQLYIGTFSNSAFTLNLENRHIFSLSHIIPSIPIRSIESVKEDEIWFGTDGGGLYVIQKEDNQLKRIFCSNEDESDNLSGNTISSVFADETNCVWISTSTNGISIFDSQHSAIQWIRHEHKNPNSLFSNHVNVILEDSDGDLWYGTNNGVSLYRKKSNKWTHFLNNKQEDGNISNVILALCEDDQKNIWVGGYGTGAFLIEKKSGNVRKIEKYTPLSNKGITTDYIFSFYSENEFVWIAGIEGKLTRYNTKDNIYTYFPEECIGDIQSGGKSILLMATCSGLGFLDITTNEIRKISSFNDLTLQYPIRCLIQSSSGDIWMATDGQGLVRYNPTTNISQIYSSDNVIKSNVINGITEDALGRIWFTTEKEFYIIAPSEDEVTCMNDFFNIEWGYFNPNACTSLKNNNLVFGTAKGVIEFSPYFDIALKDSVTVLFTDFKLPYQSVKAGSGSPINKAINETESISLKYEQNSFSIFFSSVNFTYPHQTEYVYQLENFDQQWRTASPDRSAAYMNLAPGNYTFRLQAINKYSKKVMGERAIQINIKRPFWTSWWAIACYVILFLALIYLAVQYVRNVIAKHAAREKIRIFIDVAHDIRTPISLIKAPLSEMEAKEELSEHGRELLLVATQNTEKLFLMVSQLLDLQKVDLEADRLCVTPQNIKSYMQEKIAFFNVAAIQKGIILNLDIQENFPPVEFDKDKMDKVLDNLLSNAIKYTKKGWISVCLNYTENDWIIKIEDTGIGISASEQKHLFKDFYRAKNAINSNESGSGIGLILVRKLIQLMQGKITFSSKENEGSAFIIRFPLNKNILPQEQDIKEVGKSSKDKVFNYESSEKEILLLAEDNKEMREYLKSSLSLYFEVVDVADGEKVIELAKELNPAIIISDVLMPKLRGDEVCRMIKSSVETSHIPVILLSALSEKENVILGLESGANDYVIKPFDFNILKARILRILQDREVMRKKLLSAETGLKEVNYTNQLDKDFLDRAIKIMEEELTNPDFSINEFCKILGMSRTSVYNKIKSLTSQSPNDFIRIIRLNRAKELLKTRKYTISEVGYMVGFSDPKYFSTSFKKQFGISPSKSV
ncbi:MAG: two-component regulator propeller domain-containing protein [Proteiniphilum sp.]|uniref:hybrid sensor histidine kinase/response regulator n=1 Tax=Proteiniphilum sp. TaxID=1926877 RepID=UPI002B20CA2A|nr:two-component regulator propeller domain-containing protein [Proteiniphilum sp.]MEA5130002.1 two-component regulator propeller domain-containing protein [Proteiniphilum sp.]